MKHGISFLADCQSKCIGKAASSPAAAAFLWFFSTAFLGGKKIPKSHSLLCLIEGEGEARLCSSPGRFKACTARQGSPLSCVVPSLTGGRCAQELWGRKRRFEVTGQSPHVFLQGQQDLSCKQSRSYSCPKRAMVSQKDKWQLNHQPFAAMCADPWIKKNYLRTKLERDGIS